MRLAFLIAAPNDIEILSTDIGNAYLQAPCREKLHTSAGSDLGPLCIGKIVIIVRAIHGLESSGTEWHAKLSPTLHVPNFLPSKADLYVWLRAA